MAVKSFITLATGDLMAHLTYFPSPNNQLSWFSFSHPTWLLYLLRKPIGESAKGHADEKSWRQNFNFNVYKFCLRRALADVAKLFAA
jgi:hypothetical protein